MRFSFAILLTSLALFSFHDSSSGVFALQDADDHHSLEKNPFRCTISANDHDTCVGLKKCAWCQGEGLPGICVSEYQEKALIRKLPKVKCFKEEGEETGLADTLFLRGATETTPVELMAPYDTKCLNAPSDASPDDDDPAKICDATTDSQGGMCVWCDAAGVFGLCLSHDQAEKASNYLNCDLTRPEAALLETL